VCEGSILNIGIKDKKNILAFSNAADTLHRDNLTLRISFDEGKTWAKRIPIDKSTVEGAKDFTAYSDLVKMSNKEIGVLYEKEGYAKIVFIVINWKR
jgi:sialidase-1